MSIYLHSETKLEAGSSCIDDTKITDAALNPNFLSDSTNRISWNPNYFKKRGVNDLYTELAQPATHGWDYEK